ncbi:single-stranded DNA-binding protein [Egibacter rhizosphaerae]|uniref:single-stranded DNA-binding protein n=1 Tax=Egibacter rhizosphaerae TaxID=1670831 RepID=UPI0013F14DA9|nr:single-stranded DNA-binding protein [Egibacter rhizosphaerae]
MAVENQISIIGNLADDPELRFTPNGVAVANVRVAVNRRIRNSETGEWDERLDGFFTCNVWRDMAENIADSLEKGSRVVVIGRLRSRSFEDKEGQTRWVTEIEADEICPSLRFARAQVTRNPRGGGAARSGDGDGQQASAPPPEAPDTDDVPF